MSPTDAERIVQLTWKSDDLLEALHRANDLINWMSKYIGKMAPGSYHQCYSDLNEHWLFMETKLGVKNESPIQRGQKRSSEGLREVT